MRRWLKFEILDLNAILEAIDKKNETEKRRNKQIEDRREAIKQIKDMKEGKDTLRTYFMSQNGKVNKITGLTDKVTKAENDIECLGLLHKIVVIQLNQAAIQFFKRDKFTTYNHTVNLYSQKQIENNLIKKKLFEKIYDANHQTIVNQEEKKLDEENKVYSPSKEDGPDALPEPKETTIDKPRTSKAYVKKGELQEVQSVVQEQDSFFAREPAASIVRPKGQQNFDSDDDEEMLGMLKRNNESMAVDLDFDFGQPLDSLIGGSSL